MVEAAVPDGTTRRKPAEHAKASPAPTGRSVPARPPAAATANPAPVAPKSAERTSAAPRPAAGQAADRPSIARQPLDRTPATAAFAAPVARKPLAPRPVAPSAETAAAEPPRALPALTEIVGSAQHWMQLAPRRRRRRAQALAATAKTLGRAGALRAAALVACAFLLAEPVAQQDIASLLAADADAAPRWMSRLVATGGGSDAAPTFTFAGTTDLGETPVAALSGPTGLVTLAAFQPANPPGDLPALRFDRTAKGGRQITVAASTAPGRIAAGALMTTANIVDDDMAQAALRVAFVRLPPVSSLRERALIARHDGAGETNDPATVRARLQFAQAAAATSASMVAAYAQEGDMDIEAPFRALFADPAVATGLGEEEVTAEELAVDPHAWVGKPLPASVLLNSEQRCLSEAIYFEARGESYNGQVAVSQVVLNRVRNPAYPNTICGVVYQNRKMRNACQFSFACDLVPDRVVDDRHWRQAQEIARETTAGRLKIPEIEASTHYHATYVKPRWAKSMQKQKQIGLHIFYKTYGGGWS